MIESCSLAFGALLVHPEVEAPNPVLQREAQGGVRRHHIAVAPSDPGRLQTRGHEFGQWRQRRVGGVGVALERHGMVLVGSDGLLLSGGAAEREPGPGEGRLTLFGDPELEEPARGRVDRERDDVAHVDRIRARVHQGGDHVGELADRARDRIAIGGAFDRALQCERRVAPDPHQVGVRDHADDPSARVGDREVVKAALEHAEQDLADHRVGRHGLGPRRHHLSDRGVGAAALGDDARAEVAVGQDAHRPVGGGDQQARHAFARHELGGVGHGRDRVTGDRRPPNERTDLSVPHEVDLGLQRLVDGRDPSSDAGRDERDAGARPQDLVGDLGVDQVAERVLGRPHGRGRCDLVQQRPHPEHVALADLVDHPALVHDLGPAAPDDEQMARGRGRLPQDHGAGGEVLDLDARDDAVQLGVRQRVERRMIGQEGADVHGASLRRAGHRPEPASPWRVCTRRERRRAAHPARPVLERRVRSRPALVGRARGRSPGAGGVRDNASRLRIPRRTFLRRSARPRRSCSRWTRVRARRIARRPRRRPPSRAVGSTSRPRPPPNPRRRRRR